MPRHYALVHSVAENAFQDVPTAPFYPAKYKGFLVDKRVRLNCGWANICHSKFDFKTNFSYGYI